MSTRTPLKHTLCRRWSAQSCVKKMWCVIAAAAISRRLETEVTSATAVTSLRFARGRTVVQICSENLNYADEQAEVGLVVAHHANTTEHQRARMVNVDICASSQSQRKAMLLLNVLTMNFDNRSNVATEGTIMTNHEIDAALNLRITKSTQL